MPELSPPSATLRILIIDDEVGLRNMLKYGLEKRGYTVLGAEGGEQGLELARKQPFDLAVCDIMMPGMNGIETLKALREISPTIEVIMATGFATLETAIEAMKNGAFDYITKPYSLGHLCAIFEKAVEHSRLKAKINYLEELDRLKSEFIATMSHELRTPLASTMGYISLLYRGVYGSLNDAQKTALERAEVNSKNLLELINNVLDLSKLQAKRMILTPVEFNLHDLFDEVANVIAPLTAAKNLVFEVECATAIPVNCDQLKLRQILVNLAGNAVKFTSKGRITLKAEPNADGTVTIRIRDTGVGIAKEDLPLLFQEFQQIDGSTTREFSGTGLGLAISKRLAELMGGNITVQSEPAVGTEFIVCLPVGQQALVATAEVSSNGLHVAGTGERVILAIDDDPDMIKLITDSVSGAGFRVVGARGGEEGLALARQLQPFCITLDIMMPGMSGWDVLHAIKNDRLLQAIPVYIVSLIEDQPQALALGVTGYIHKPFTPEELLRQLSLITRKSQQVMVVDDDAHIREVFSKALSAEGYEVIPVESGEEALARMKTLCPDILFLDLALPGISGFDVLVALEEQPNSSNMSVFVMTGKELNRDQQDYLRRRVQLVIQKGSQSLPELVDLLKKKLPSIQAAA